MVVVDGYLKGFRPGTLVYVMTAAGLHAIDELTTRFSGPLDDSDGAAGAAGLLAHLREVCEFLAGLVPEDGSGPFLFSHLDRPAAWSFDLWFATKARPAAASARDAIEAWLHPADHPPVSYDRHLEVCQAYLSAIHDQLLDDGLVIEDRPDPAA